MRIGKRMREILKVLNDVGKSLTLTEIIMRVMGVAPYRTHYTQVKDDQGNWIIHEIEKPWPRYVQCELASAIAESSISNMGLNSTWVNERKTGKRYHPVTYADKKYALYSRSMKLLVEHGLINKLNKWKTNRGQYEITEKGRMLIEVSTGS